MPAVKRTELGFRTYTEFSDIYGVRVSVLESSITTKRCCWISAQKDRKDGVFHLGYWYAYSPHLSAAMARRVAKALLRFADGKENKPCQQ